MVLVTGGSSERASIGVTERLASQPALGEDRLPESIVGR